MSSSQKPTAQIGVTGLAVMGSNIARNFARHGHTVALHNRSIAKTDALIAEHGSEGDFVRTETVEEFVAALQKPRRVLIMVKAGAGTDAVIVLNGGTWGAGIVRVSGENARIEVGTGATVVGAGVPLGLGVLSGGMENNAYSIGGGLVAHCADRALHEPACGLGGRPPYCRLRAGGAEGSARIGGRSPGRRAALHGRGPGA